MAYRTLLAACTAVASISVPGCAALGLAGGLRSLGALPENTRSGALSPVPGVLADAGDSIFRVVAWSFAVIVGALALAFAARLLNARPKPAIAPARGPLETDRILQGRTP